MTLPARRVRHLRLRAPTEELGRRGALVIEDAFHTASLPMAEDVRLWIIRRLTLGRIQGRFGTATVALALEQKIRWLDSSAVHAENPAAANADTVYFHDVTEPYLCLAKRLLTNAPTTEWFWPLAVPGWTADRAEPERWRRLIFGVLRQPAGVVAMAGILRELKDHGVDRALSAALQPADGGTLLEICGWNSPTTGNAPVAPFEAAGPERLRRWRRFLEFCGGAWGRQDARTLWLAAMALVAEKPTRLAQAGLIDRAQKLMARVRNSAVENASGYLAEHSNEDLSDEVRRAGSGDTCPPMQMGPGTGLISNARETEMANPRPVMRMQPKRSSHAPSLEAPSPTCYAGLFLLLRVFERLGLAGFLNKHQDLIELEFPHRLLRQLAGRLGAAIDDPVWEPLTLTETDGSIWPEEFVLPPSWSNGLARSGPWRVCRLQGRRGARRLCDASGRLVVAQWQNKAPADVSAVARNRVLRRTAPRICEDVETMLLDTWLTAVRRWCRRFAGIGLRTLVCRPGRISVTRTHLDLFFDHRQADVRVRRAGLDLDPGWLPWLGRVVTFHYLDR